MSNYVYTSNQPYLDYLQQKEFIRDIEEGMQGIRSTVSEASLEVVASLEQLTESNYKVYEAMAESQRQAEELTEITRDGFKALIYETSRISDKLDDIDATFHWGFSALLSSMGSLNRSVETLVALTRTPSQTWADEQFSIARDYLDRDLYPEALDALSMAINGFGSHLGYKGDWRYHYMEGTIRLGGVSNYSPGVVYPAKAIESFENAARYAASQDPAAAARAMAGAAWASYCQGKMEQCIGYSKRAMQFNPELAEAYFLSAKAHFHLENPNEGITQLAPAIRLERDYSLKALGDGDCKKFESNLHELLVSLREEASSRATAQFRCAEDALAILYGLRVAATESPIFDQLANDMKIAKHYFGTETYYGYLDAERIARRCSDNALEKSNECKVLLNDLLRNRFSTINSRFINTSSHKDAPKAFSAVGACLDATHLNPVERAIDFDKQNESLAALEEKLSSAITLARKHMEAVRETEAYNAKLVPNGEGRFALGCLHALIALCLGLAFLPQSGLAVLLGIAAYIFGPKVWVILRSRKIPPPQ